MIILFIAKIQLAISFKITQIKELHMNLVANM